MLLQSTIVWALGLATLVVGFIANLKFNGLGAAAIFLGIVLVMVYFLAYQIECLIHGHCQMTSWFNVALAGITITGVFTYYYIAIRNGALPSLSKQDLFRLSTLFQTTRSLVSDKYNVDITDYIDKLPFQKLESA
jgi:hypothetical protein